MRRIPFGRQQIGALLAVALVALVAVLFRRDTYVLNLATTVGVNTLVALGLNILMGYAGQVSLGQAAFVGIGAYSTAILGSRCGLSPWLGMAVGVGLSAAVAALIGMPVLRLRGHYLAMGTLGFGVIVHIVMVQWESLTTGTIGISGIPTLSIAGFAFDTELRLYGLVAAAVLLAMLLSANVINSRVGRAMRALHGSEVAAATCGVDLARCKLHAFVLSAALAGLAGSLFAHQMGYVNPDRFGLPYSIELVVMVVIGGMASIGGAIFGAGAVTLIAESLRQFQEFSVIIFGAVLMAIMIFLPAGLWRTCVDGLSRAATLRRPPSQAAPEGRS